jgi:hypothetical protein
MVAGDMKTSTAPATPKSLAARDRAPGQIDPLDRLRGHLDTLRMKDKRSPGAFAEFELELHTRVMELERDVVAAEMAELDVDAEAVLIAGKLHRRVLRRAQTYVTSAGEVVVERTLYKDRTDDEGHAVSPMELTLGIVGDFWTPRAAQQALWVVTQMTPKKGEELFQRIGNMAPSKSSLDRLPKLIDERWEGQREAFEEALREGLVIPEGAASMTVSLDGVMAPMEDTAVTERRTDAAAEGRVTKGPLGYREVGCATVSFCDDKGDLLGAIRMARAPEPKKATLKQMLAKEVAAALRARPDLKLVKIADAFADNWAFLSSALPEGHEAIDFFHATEHLHAAIAAAYGDGTLQTQHRFETLREALRDEEGGVDKVISALRYLTTKHPRRPKVRQGLNYFRTHRARMNYAALKKQGLMIGSGVVEAACKTLVTQRLKNSGMRWSHAGAQAILTPRGWTQSERFDEAWALLAATFRAEVTVLANVIAIRPDMPRRSASR